MCDVWWLDVFDESMYCSGCIDVLLSAICHCVAGLLCGGSMYSMSRCIA